MSAIIRVEGLSKVYAGGFRALDGIDLDIEDGEIFALLGPNGAGKTTLIGSICGLVRLGEGRISVAGLDVVRSYRPVRGLIGLVPQELTIEPFVKVVDTVSFSRRLHGKPPDAAHVESLLKNLSLWDKKDSQIFALSGGMKRRVMIAKALAHQPRVLFLDEPTAGVDVTLRQDMWRMVRSLRESGTTVVLTTHYLEEAEEMADRIGVINRGRLILVQDKQSLMRKLGSKRLVAHLREPVSRLPDELPALFGPHLTLSGDGMRLVYEYDGGLDDPRVGELLRAMDRAGLGVRDLETDQRSLEEIFVDLVKESG